MTTVGPRPFAAGDQDWRDNAACQGEDTELFFPMDAGRLGAIQSDQARRICLRCDVRTSCLDWALDNGEDHGVWGGHTPDERRRIKRLRRAEAKAVAA